MLPPEWQSIRRILVTHADPSEAEALSPALRVIQQALPLATITLMSLDADRQVASLVPWSDDATASQVPEGVIACPGFADETSLTPDSIQQLIRLIRKRQFDAAILFTLNAQSPYPAAYVAYLAGIPIRVGQSQEFGGGVLSHWVKPSSDVTGLSDPLALLQSIGFPVAQRSSETNFQGQAQPERAPSSRVITSRYFAEI